MIMIIAAHHVVSLFPAIPIPYLAATKISIRLRITFRRKRQ
jgi:hypothetical protein